MIRAGARAWSAWWPLLPLLLVPALLPVGRASELGTLLALVASLYLLVRERGALLRLPSVRLFALLFLAYAAAAAWSLPDSLAPQASWRSFASLWRYLPLGLYACWVLRKPGRGQQVSTVVAVLLALWLLDAWAQIFTGWSVGGSSAQLRITGVFGADNKKLGPVLAVLSPFLLHALRARWGWRGLVAGFLFLLGPIVLAGSRQAWLQFALVGAVFIWQAAGTPRRRAGWLVAAALAGVLAIAVGWQTSPGFAQRMERSAELLDGNLRGLDWALSGRLYIWGDAWRMLAEHPINGVGVRAFRHAYPAYAHADDPFIAGESCGPGEGACHPHQVLLEVASASGVPGLLLWLAAAWLALRAWRRAAPEARQRAAPVSLALAANLFPLNTHLAFYSSWWGLLSWWLLALWCGLLLADREDGHGRA